MKIRGMHPADENFILATMLRGVGHYGLFREMEPSAFFSNYEPIVKRLLQTCDVRILCLDAEPGDEDVIIGYCIFSGDVLHYLYVKKAWRGQGLSKKLLQGLQPKYTSHLTSDGMWYKLKLQLEYNPWKL